MIFEGENLPFSLGDQQRDIPWGPAHTGRRAGHRRACFSRTVAFRLWTLELIRGANYWAIHTSDLLNQKFGARSAAVCSLTSLPGDLPALCGPRITVENMALGHLLSQCFFSSSRQFTFYPADFYPVLDSFVLILFLGTKILTTWIILVTLKIPSFINHWWNY